MATTQTTPHAVRMAPPNQTKKSLYPLLDMTIRLKCRIKVPNNRIWNKDTSLKSIWRRTNPSLTYAMTKLNCLTKMLLSKILYWNYPCIQNVSKKTKKSSTFRKRTDRKHRQPSLKLLRIKNKELMTRSTLSQHHFKSSIPNSKTWSPTSYLRSTFLLA